MTGEEKKALWAKCAACLHCWAIAYLPMEITLAAKLMGEAKHCPKCGAPKPVVAKQKDGVLLEEPAA